jgi:eukaryotic-like serine/threonine-protein kinase
MNRSAQPVLERPPARGERDLARVASAIQSVWRKGTPPDAAAALAADEQLAADRPLALELAYEEFCLREEAGEKFDTHRFADRFTFRTSLLRLIEIHGLLNHCPDLLPQSRPAVRHEAGDVVGDFEIVRQLGQGGFADVYLARDNSAGRRGVVLKLSARNEHEADTLGPLSHPHLMPVYSAPSIDGVRAVVMPYYGVTTLERLVTDPTTPASKRGRDILKVTADTTDPNDPPVTPSPPFGVRPNDSFKTTVRAIAGGVASALEYLHGRGVTHRDVKPANVLLGPTGHPYLLDFNLAAGTTSGGRIGGTLPYLAPEVLAALGSDDGQTVVEWAAADVFAFGVLVWELLTGRHPYLSDIPFRTEYGQFQLAGTVAERQQTFLRTSHGSWFRPRSTMWRLIGRCLATNPADRPTTAELAKAFARPKRWLAPWVVAAGIGACVLTGTLVQASSWRATPKDEFSKGVEFYRDGQLDLAAAAFAKAGQANNDGKAYAYAAYCQAAMKNSRAAVYYVGLARSAGHNDLPLFLTAAYSSLLHEDLEVAAAECDTALKIDPTCRPALLTRCYIRFQQARKENRPVDRQTVVDFGIASRDGELPGAVWLVGAHVYLDVIDHQKCDLDRAADAVRNAVNSGTTAREIVGTRSLDSRLKNHPVYQQALQLPANPNPPNGNPYLICPID